MTTEARNVLVVNSGSSSVKYQVVDPQTRTRSVRGLVERIGIEGTVLHQTGPDGDRIDLPVETVEGDGAHAAALAVMLDALRKVCDLDTVVAVGHRVVHGGPDFTEPTLIDDAVVDSIRETIPLAPLHNPGAVAGMTALRAELPQLPHVAVFDTAFHATMDRVATTYAVPRELTRELGLRRYGFHGSSYRYVARTTSEYFGLSAEDSDFVICHIGNGASICAVRGGRSVDTSMGMAPSEGLVMGTRSGDVDLAVVATIMRAKGYDADGVEDVLTKHSGLEGMAGTSDMREILRRMEEGDDDATLAREVYIHRLRKYVGAYLALMPTAKALVFTGGIGENDPELRRDVCAGMAHLGISLDLARNDARPSDGQPMPVDDGTSSLRVIVIPTDEEAEIARQAQELLAAR